MSDPANAEVLPTDGVEVGRVLGAWGIKGGIKVQAFCGDPQALLSSRLWLLKPPENPAGAAASTPGGALALHVSEVREQSGCLVALAAEVDDRNAAEALRGWRVLVSRSLFPPPDPGEFYWVDLIGSEVLNREGLALGRVSGLVDTGAHPVLRVAEVDPTGGVASAGQERLIPFVDAYVDEVDLPARRIRVDWSPEWDRP